LKKLKLKKNKRLDVKVDAKSQKFMSEHTPHEVLIGAVVDAGKLKTLTQYAETHPGTRIARTIQKALELKEVLISINSDVDDGGHRDTIEDEQIDDLIMWIETGVEPRWVQHFL